MTAKVAIALIIATTALASCSSDDEPSQPTVSDMALPTLATATTTTAAATTTSMLPGSTTTTTTTTTSTTTPTTVTSPTTSTPTPTLVSPDDITEAEALDRQMAIDVERDWVIATERLRQAQTDPTNPDLIRSALEYTAGDWIEHTERVIQGFAERGERLLPEPRVAPTLIVLTPPAPVADTSDEVTIIVCESAAWVVVDAQGAVLSDQLYALKSEVRLRLEGDVWKTVHTALIKSTPGSDTCSD